MSSLETLEPDQGAADHSLRPPRLGGSAKLGLAAMAIAALLAVPIGAVAVLAFADTGEIWPQLAGTVLPLYIQNTLLLMAGVGAVVFAMGVGAAWCVAMYEFPGRKLFDWALLMPLAMPAYVVAYAYTDFLDHAGPVQQGLHALFGAPVAFPEIRSLGGAIFVMGVVLYPYVYMSARAAFLAQTRGQLEVARTLGTGPWGVFFRIGLPMARPAIVVGMALALMECLNDFGTVDFFAVRTLAAGLYDVWLSMGSLGGAAQIAVSMMGFVVLLITIERLGRRGQHYHALGGKLEPPSRILVRGVRGWAMTGLMMVPILFGLIIPVWVLIGLSLQTKTGGTVADFFLSASHSTSLAALAALTTVGLGLVLAYGGRLAGRGRIGQGARAAGKIASLGYAIPGAVLAVGLLVPLGHVDQALNDLSDALFDFKPGAVLGGTLFALVAAYTVRFMALGHGAVETGLDRVTPNMDMAARTLGAGPFSILRRVHLPLIRGSLLTGGVLIFVDVMKELPATLLLRPFNYETLATLTYTYASLEQLEDAALPALAIAAFGLIPVIVMSRQMIRDRRA